MLALSEHWIFLLFLQYYVVLIFFECCLSSGGILLSFYFNLWAVFCVYLFIYYACLLFCFILGVLSPWGFLWRAGSCFPSAWGSAVWSVGPVLFIWVLAGGGWRGCTGFFSLGLCCGGYGTIETVGGVWSFFLCRLQFAVCSVGRWLSVVGLLFFL